MKEQEFDSLMRKKLEGYQPGFRPEQKGMGWTALTSQLPLSPWQRLLNFMRQWFWVPVVFLLTLFNWHWWQQASHYQRNAQQTVKTMHLLHQRFDSLSNRMEANRQQSVKDTIYVWHQPYGTPITTANVGWGSLQRAGVAAQPVPLNHRRQRFSPIPSGSRRTSVVALNSWPTKTYSSENQLIENNSHMVSTNPTGKEFDGNGTAGSVVNPIATDDAETGRVASFGTEATRFVEEALVVKPLTPSLLTYDTAAAPAITPLLVNTEARKLKRKINWGHIMGTLLPTPQAWGFSTGMGSPSPQQGEAYFKPQVGLQFDFAYDKQWQLSLGVLYTFRRYELYDVYETNYGTNLISRMPGLERYRFGDFIEDIESMHHQTQLPLQLRYLPKRTFGKVRPFFGVGWVGTLGWQQQFEYRFEDEEDDNDTPQNPNGFPTFGRDNNLKFWAGTTEFAAGIFYPVGRQWHLQLQAYYQHEFSATNLEQNPFRTFGLRLAMMRIR